MIRIIKSSLFAIIFFSAMILSACSDNTSSELNLGKFHGRWVFINYWASWCESCKLEIPELNAFAKKHSSDVVFLGVNYDGLEGSALKRAIEQAHIEFTVLTSDPHDTLKLGPVNAVPTTFVFDPQGNLADTLLGPQSQTNLEKIIK